ncbi:MAG: Fe-S-containing hydro-lyase [Xylanivirga thermophila]|jgi:fumarate hydratase subunit beta|uniref:Fe-S-containing hydro-lyase n=1 Tax=Xylanivirga thermophila TaxID=2496273 RepID=UPI00101DC7C0|nr:Fe-S-containing hydro-lyase [Xylanivirga thermophila]
MIQHIHAPAIEKEIINLKAGDIVQLSGTIITGRDAAHERLVNMVNRGENLPILLKNEIIYYTGPCPAKPGQVIGPCGPTTSSRMDTYAPRLLDLGLKGMIGKGERSEGVIESIIKNKAVYFAATGGAGALITTCIKKAQVIAFADLGPEAIYRLEVEKFPLIVAIDAQGNSLYNFKNTIK